MRKLAFSLLFILSLNQLSAQFSEVVGIGYSFHYMPVSDGLDLTFKELQNKMNIESSEILHSLKKPMSLHGVSISNRYYGNELVLVAGMSYAMNITYVEGVDLNNVAYYHKFQMGLSKFSASVYYPFIDFNNITAGPSVAIDYNRFSVKRSLENRLILMFRDNLEIIDYISAQIRFPIELTIDDTYIQVIPFADFPYVRQNWEDLLSDLVWNSSLNFTEEELKFKPLMFGVSLIFFFPF